MPEYICSSCGISFEADPDPQGQIVCSSCGAVQTAASAQKVLPAGTRVGGYEIIRHIADGGSGSVYLAEQLNMERTVALKILNRDQVSKEDAERFLVEARNGAKFEHPHVVQVIDTGISPEGHYYIAMQYVEGETLEEILQRGRAFSEDEALIIVLTVADALRSIWHKNKMFHKDIKPGNIMLTPENEAMLLDMGTAQERGESKLADGNIEGSPYYMSPEQARGEALTWSTDLYSLGATLYQMVTGKYLYDGANVESILQQHDSAPFPDPSERAPGMKISAGMTALLERMLAKKPSARHSSWDEFIREAQTLLEDILKKKGASVSSNVRKQYMQLNAHPFKPERKIRQPASGGRLVCFILLIFALSAMLLGGVFLYLAVQKNSRNARMLLKPLREQVGNLNINPDQLDYSLRKAEPYFTRIGVLPSIRQEFSECQRKAAAFREKIHQEEKTIIELESATAGCIQSADQEVQKAKAEAAAKNPQKAAESFRQAMKQFYQMSKTIRETEFLLPSSQKRAQQLLQRLKTSRSITFREMQLFWKQYPAYRPHRPGRRPGPPPPPKPAAPKVSAAPASTPPTAMKSSVSSKVPEKKTPDPEPREKYRRTLRREKDRIRAELLLQSVPEKIRPGNPIWKLRFKREPFKAENEEFDRWLGRMKQLPADTERIWNSVYNTHKELAGLHIAVMTPDGETDMEVKDILRDQVILFRPGMPNIKLSFAQLPPAGWLDLLQAAAKKQGLQAQLENYWLADGWFFAAEKSRDPFIKAELPRMREVIYRYLTGKDIPGVKRAAEEKKKSLVKKYQIDPSFARYRAKAGKNKPNKQKTSGKQQKEKGAE